MFAEPFPTLSRQQVEKLASHSDLHAVEDGHILIDVGERNHHFFIVDKGKVRFAGELLTRGQFTGDISHVTGAPSTARVVAVGDCEVLAIPTPKLHHLLASDIGLSDIILQAFIARRDLSFDGLSVIGSRFSQDTFRIRDFLSKNRVRFEWVDLETDQGVAQLLKQFGVTESQTPIVTCGDRFIMRNPSNIDLARQVGLCDPLASTTCDLAIIGAGPAGLAAAVYGASEGLETVILERSAPGGQAGCSMRIENYLGFPTGITGSELAGRATIQAQKFGARLMVPSALTQLSFDGALSLVQTDSETIVSRALLIATGADYRRLEVEGCERFEGRGVYYSATPNDVELCRGATVLVVGGGNSAGQAAVFLSTQGCHVLLVVRGDDLYKSMSSYLAKRIEDTSNIELCYQTTVQKLHGDSQLNLVEIYCAESGSLRMVETGAIFSFIGAVPRTSWLPQEIETDGKGFVRTGGPFAHWTERRPSFPLETSRPGVFAAGDVRSGSVKRVASAVGEGAMAVQFIHQYLAGA